MAKECNTTIEKSLTSCFHYGTKETTGVSALLKFLPIILPIQNAISNMLKILIPVKRPRFPPKMIDTK